MEFRRNALATLDAPEELDTPVRLTRSRGWIALAGLALVVLTGVIWTFAGTVPRDATAMGVLMESPASFPLQSTVDGELTDVLVAGGDTFPAGAPVARVTVEGRVETVRASAAGRVTDVLVQPGQHVAPGTTVATAENIAVRTGQLAAAVYLPADSGAPIGVGHDVDLSVRSVPSQTYGVLRGTVMYVDRTPEARWQIAAAVGDELAGQITGKGPTAKVVVMLRPSGKTVSGYAWSTAAGPPDKLASGTPLTATIHLSPYRPIEVMSP